MNKLRWPFDTAITIAIFSLTLSFVQFLFNTPIFVNFYFRPNVRISGSGSSLDSETIISTFFLRNEGKASANNVEVGFVLQKKQRIKIEPEIKSEIVVTREDPVLKDVRLEIPRLYSGEQVFIFVSPGDGGEVMTKSVIGFMKLTGIREIPYVSFIRSEFGNGEIITSEH